MSDLMRGFERDTLVAAWNAKRVWLTHVLLNLGLIAAFYFWLLIPDRRSWQIAATAVLALIWTTIALWLQAATFQYFVAAHSAPEAWTLSWRRSARNIPAFAIFAALLMVLIFVWGTAMDYLPQIGGWLRHLLPGFIRTHVSVLSVTRAAHGLIIVVFPLLVPLYLWPLLREAAVRDWVRRGAWALGGAVAVYLFLLWWF